MYNAIKGREDSTRTAIHRHQKLPYYPGENGFEWTAFVAAHQKSDGKPFSIQVERSPERGEIVSLGRDGRLHSEIFFGLTSKRDDGKLGRGCFGLSLRLFRLQGSSAGMREIFVVDGFDDEVLRTPPCGIKAKILAFHTDPSKLNEQFAYWFGRLVPDTKDKGPTEEECVNLLHLRASVKEFILALTLSEGYGPKILCVQEHLESRIGERMEDLEREIASYETAIQRAREEILRLK